MKKTFTIICVILSATILVLLAFHWISHNTKFCFKGVHVSVSHVDILETISDTNISPANNQQQNASVWMGVYNGKLFFIPSCGTNLNRTQYDGWLNRFDDGKITKLISVKQLSPEIIGMIDGILYFHSRLSPHVLYALSLEDLSLQKVFSFSELPDVDSAAGSFQKNSFFAGDGTMYLPFFMGHKNEPRFLHVSGDAVLEVCEIPEEYFLGEYVYSLEREYHDDSEQVVRTSPEGKREVLMIDFAQSRQIIPAEHGLLIHNDDSYGRGVMLYYIDENGDMVELFSAPQLSSKSAVTVYGSYVFFSFKRWEEYGEIGMKRFENDEMEGTYKINLNDFSIEKLSNKIYDGLYIFDDTGIYACDEYCSIIKMDFDGNIIEMLMEVKVDQQG